ncbi:MAG: DUF3277 family protein [Phascolarctobacterium sp.]|nr:DUF3277 family protein [Phascolarctobacterium sp.]MBR6636842.1 DUF3277 family protein [Phascolarctobacterium sp.]
MSALKTYDPKKVNVIYGPVIMTGFAESTFVTVETRGEGTEAIVGCDQEIVRSMGVDSVLKLVTVTLLQSSDSNDKLSLLHDADNVSQKGLLPLAIKDLSGRSVMMSDQAWIVKKPTFKRGKTANDGALEWQFLAVVPDEAFLIGGHD